MILRRVGTVGSVGVAYHIPAASHPDWAPLNLLGGILSQSPNGRLYKALVESKLATSANARGGNTHDPGLFTANASAEPAQLDAVRDTLLKVLENLSATPFTADEVEKAKLRSKRNAEQLPANASGMAQALELGVVAGRLAPAVHPARPHRRGHGRRREPRGPNLFQEAQPHRRHLHSGDGAATAGGPRGAGDRQHRQGLQGRRDHCRGRGVRSVAGQSGCSHEVRRVRGFQGRPVAQEESRRDGVAGADTALRQRGIAQGAEHRGGHAARPDDGRHEEARSPGAARGTRLARHSHFRWPRRLWPRRPRGGRGGGGGGTSGQLTFSVDAKRDTLPQALELLGEILREPAFPEAEFETVKRRDESRSRGLVDRPVDPGQLETVTNVVAVRQGRRALRADARREPRSRWCSDARPDQDPLRNTSWRRDGGTGRRRRLRPGRHPFAGPGDAQGLEVESADQADRPQRRRRQ